MVSCLILKSLNHFEFILVYAVRGWSNFIDPHVAVQFSQHHLLKRLFFHHCTFLPPLFTSNWPQYVWIHLRAFFSVPLINMSVFVSIPHCFDYCSFVVLSEVWKSYASCFVLLFSPLRIALAILGLLWFHINFWIICSSSVKNVMAILIWGSH